MPASLLQGRLPPIGLGGQPTSEPGPGPGPDGTLSRLLESLLDEAPTLVRQRSLLPAFDWRAARPSQVERLLERLADSGASVPAWLARGLLVAGHRVPASAVQKCPPEIAALAALNEAGAAGIPESLSQQLLDCALFEDLEAGTAAQIAARFLALGETSLACRVALSQLVESPEALRTVRDHWAAEIESLPRLSLRLAGTSTTHGFATALRPAFAALGYNAAVSESDFASYIAALLAPDPDSDALVILLDHGLLTYAGSRGGVSVAASLAHDKIDTLIGAIDSYCRNATKPLLINTLAAPPLPAAGHIDRHHPSGDAFLVAEVNRRLSEIAARETMVLVVDSDVALGRIAPTERSDPRLWFYGREAYSERATRALGRGFARVWHAKERRQIKVLALDFDNTLWGGVFGDDGIDGLKCGDDFPGNAYKALQQECLRLKNQGMLLIGLSKNNPDAFEVFSRHPGMALKGDDFVATAINWDPKPDNIQRLAGDLGLGVDSFLFLDDSPHEREAMRRMCPSVTVPEMPADPAKRPLWLRSLACTWPLRLTEEDSRRSDMYVAERRGRELKNAAGSFEEYLAGLQQVLVVTPVRPETIARAAQLHQRTNQFNLTTRRLTESEIRTFMLDEEGALCLIGQVRDRFGDHGIVLAACVTIDEATARIETFVMSCRVIGRQIEAALLEALMTHLRQRGVTRIVGLFRPTAKNGVVADFYPSQGFVAAPAEDGTELWEHGTTENPSCASRTRHVNVEWGLR